MTLASKQLIAFRNIILDFMALLTYNCDLNDFNQSMKLKSDIIQRWDELQNIPGVFRYKLNVRSDKILDGKWGIYLQLNPDRALLRRLPEQIGSLTPVFDESKFNFNKVKSEEVIVNVKWKNSIFALLTNQSPLTPYHCLICPRIRDNIPQIINEESIDFSLKFLVSLNDRNFRIGYNSPGALASVNHLHLHLIYLEQELLIDRVDLDHVKNGIFKTPCDFPIKSFCLILNASEEDKEFDTTQVEKIYKIIKVLCKESIPHNLFFTPDRNSEQFRVKVFIFVREKPCVVKDVLALNLAFCEFSGYVPVGDEDLYNAITQDYVITKIQSEIGNIFEIVEGKILDL